METRSSYIYYMNYANKQTKKIEVKRTATDS